MTVFWVVLGLFFVACVYTLVRNELVFRYRMSQLDRVSEKATADISDGRDWEWRYDELAEPSYARMVLSVKPLDRFYPRDPARSER